MMLAGGTRSSNTIPTVTELAIINGCPFESCRAYLGSNLLDRSLEVQGFARCSAKLEIYTPGPHGSSHPLLSRRGPTLLHLSAGVTQLQQPGSHGSNLRMTGVHLYPELIRLDCRVTRSRIRVPMMELLQSEQSDVFF